VIQNCARLASPLRVERRWVHTLGALALLGIALGAVAEAVAGPPLDGPGLVLMLRHALEPGSEPRVLGPITPRTP
jgi:hypothetical protein